MKKTIEILALSALVVVSAASCNKEAINAGESGEEAGKTVSMSLLVTDENSDPEAKTLLDVEKEGKFGVVFTSADKLFVFGEKDGDVKGVQFTTADKGRKPSYTFSTEAWPEGYAPTYAITSTSTDTKQVCTTDGKITLQVNNGTQKLAWTGSYATNTTAHVGVVSEGGTSLKNVCGLIKFEVENEDIAKIVVTGNGGEVLGGWITVDYSKIASDATDFYTPGTDVVKKLELSVAETLDNGKITTSGCFPKDTPFFISLLPGEYSSGLTFKLFNSKGDIATRVVGGSLPIRRSQIRGFNKPLDDGLEFKAPEMPDRLVFSMVKGSWPFVETCLTSAEQQEVGDEYTYNYTTEDGYCGQFKFRIYDNTKSYSTSETEVIKFAGADGYVQFPAIPGRVLQSVTLQTRNADPGKSYAISETTTGKELADGRVAKTDVVLTWHSDGIVKTKPNTSYYLRCLQSSSMYTKIEAVYVKELTPTPIVVPEEFTAVLDFSEAWPFENAVAAKASQAEASGTYDGEIYDFKYSETATLKFQICKGKVNEYVYTNPSSGTPGSLDFPRKPAEAPYVDQEGFLKLPAVPGRYLKEVKITANVNAHTIYICKSNQKATSGDGVLASFTTKALSDGAASSGELDGEVNTPYYLFRNSSTAQKYVKIGVTYSTKH